jgi:hypothetical protein
VTACAITQAELEKEGIAFWKGLLVRLFLIARILCLGRPRAHAQSRLDRIRKAADSMQRLRMFTAKPGLFRGGKLSCGFQDLAGQIIGHA